MSKLLALDQSSRITGWAIFENGKLLKYGKFNAESVGPGLGERLNYIRNTIKNIVVDNEIDEVIFEDIQMQGNVVNNVQTFKALAEVIGIISELLVELKIPQSAALASSWKSALGIRGRARAEQKRNARLWVEQTYAVKPTQDECDAVCIGSYKSRHAVSEEGFSWAD